MSSPALTTLWIAVGGAVGSIARYHLGLAIARRWQWLPWGTLVINVVGSLLLGVVMGLALRERIGEATRLAIGVGVLGGFTTYSTFNFETLVLLEAGHHGRAALYVAATLVGCLVLGFVGFAVGRAIG